MSVLNLVKKLRDQVNPLDGGKTWSSPQGQGILQKVQPGFSPAPGRKIDLVNPFTFSGIDGLAPQIQTQQGNQAALNAQKQLQFTPQFALNVSNSSPAVQSLAPNANIKNVVPAAQYQKQIPNQIVFSDNVPGQTSTEPNTVLHEGLHRVYDTNPQVRQQFIQAYNKAPTSAIKNYLTSRLHSYSGFDNGLDAGGVPIQKYNLNDISSLPQNLQNEAHSFASELPSQGIQLPPALNKYYSQYYNIKSPEVDKRIQKYKIRASINNILNPSQYLLQQRLQAAGEDY